MCIPFPFALVTTRRRAGIRLRCLAILPSWTFAIVALALMLVLTACRGSTVAATVTPTPPSPATVRASPTVASVATPTERPTTIASATPPRSASPHPPPTSQPTSSDGKVTPGASDSFLGLPLDLDAIDFPTTGHGWVAGQGVILATSDGGETWERQYSGPETIRQLDFSDDHDGWAVADHALLQTIDQGKTWTPVGEPPAPLTRVQFVSPMIGWGTTAPTLVGSYQTGDVTRDQLYLTLNAGQTWTRVATPGPIASACFVDTRHGWVANAPAAAKPFLDETTDAGQTWHPVALPPGIPHPNQVSVGAPFPWQTLQCVSPRVLWDRVDLGPIGAGGGESYVLDRSPDGGQHWQGVVQHVSHDPSLAKVSPVPGKSDGAFDAVDAMTAYLTDTCSIGCWPPEGTTALGRTTDGGRTWQNFPSIPGLPAAFTALSFPTPTQGWLLVRWSVPPPAGSTILPARSAILATRDGGMIWTLQAPRPPASHPGVVDFANAQVGCLGGRMTISCTADGGRTWSTNWPGLVEIVQLRLVDAQVGWAIARSLLEPDLLPGPEARKAYDVGSPSIVLGTTDGGQHWRYLANLGGVRSIDFVDHQHGWAITDQALLGSTDGGKTWQLRSAVPSAGLSARYDGIGPYTSPISFVSPTLGWAVGSDNEVLQTTDGGITWARQWIAPFGASLNTGPVMIRFSSPRIGWLLLTMGQGCASQEAYALYRTLDGGAHWNLELVGPGACGRIKEPHYPANGPFGAAGYPLAFTTVDADHAWLVVFSPASSRLNIQGTADGGQNWQRIASLPGNVAATSLEFVNDSDAWLVTQAEGGYPEPGNALTLQTTDGGHTWTTR